MENLEQNQPPPAVGSSTSPSAPQSATQPLNKEPKLKNRFLLPIFLSLFTLLLGGGLVFAYFVFIKPEKIVPQPIVSSTPVPVTSPSSLPTPDPTVDWEIYKNEEYGFEIKYPGDWSVNQDSQVFKEGKDIFAIWIWGATQKKDTELYDGASFTIGIPIKTEKNVKTWVKEYYPEKNINGEPNIFSQEVINGQMFQKVFTCGLGCFTYYNIKKGDYIYRLMVSVGGPDEEQYKQIINQILSAFRFLD